MKLDPVHFLVGTDAFQQRLYLEELRKKVFPKGSAGLNDDTFYSKEKTWPEIFDLANTMPMLATHRMIVVRIAGNLKEDDQERWLAYLENPAPHTVLVALLEKVDKRTKFARTIAKSGRVQEMGPPRPQELPAWADRIAQRHGVTFAPGARRALIEAVGTDLAIMDREAEKLSLYCHPETKIPELLVIRFVLQMAGGNIFTWTDQVVEGHGSEAIDTLHHLLGNGTPPLVLVTMLARHLRILLKARHHGSQRTGRGQLSSALGVPPFTVSRYMEQAGRTTMGGLRRAMELVQKLDGDLKSTGHPAEFLVERTIRGITQSTHAVSTH